MGKKTCCQVNKCLEQLNKREVERSLVPKYLNLNYTLNSSVQSSGYQNYVYNLTSTPFEINLKTGYGNILVTSDLLPTTSKLVGGYLEVFPNSTGYAQRLPLSSYNYSTYLYPQQNGYILLFRIQGNRLQNTEVLNMGLLSHVPNQPIVKQTFILDLAKISIYIDTS